MLRQWMVVLLALALAPGTASAGGDYPPDPGADGDWLAWAWIDPGEGEHRAALVDLFGNALRRACERAVVADEADRRVLEAAIGCARVGCPTGVWLVPAASADRVRIRARIWKVKFAKPVLMRFTLIPMGDRKLTKLWFTETADLDAEDIWPDDRLPTKHNPEAPALSAESLHEWPAHRAVAAKSDGLGMFEFALNLNAIRLHWGDEFDVGRGGAALLGALHLANARVLGVLGRVIAADRVAVRDPSLPKVGGEGDAGYAGPALVSLTASWTARSEPPGRVRTWAMTTGYWPRQQLGEPPARVEASFVVGSRVAWRRAVSGASAVYAAMLPVDRRDSFATEWGAWVRDGGVAADRLALGLEPWLAMYAPKDGQKAGLSWRVNLKPDVAAKSAAGTMEKALAAASGCIEGTPILGATIKPGSWWEFLALELKIHGEAAASGGKAARPAWIGGTVSWSAPPVSHEMP